MNYFITFLNIFQTKFSYFSVAHYLKLPVIAFSSTGASRWSDEMVKNPVNPAYNPNMFLGFTDEMNFLQRLVNTAMTVVDQLVYQ